MAVERVQEGEAPSAVIASYGFCRTTIYKWLNKVRRGGRGDPLRSRKGTGRPAKLTKKQKRQVFRWINGKDPRQHGFDFGLWTRQIVAQLIADRFGHRTQPRLGGQAAGGAGVDAAKATDARLPA